MAKKKVMIMGCGGAAGINFTRCIKDEYYTIGLNTNKLALEFAETDEKYLINNNVDRLKYIRETQPDFIHAQPDPEVLWLSRYNFNKLMPSEDVVKVCQDKFKTAEALAWRGGVYTLKALPNSIRYLLDIYKTVWIRSSKGAGGENHLKTSDWDTAVKWAEQHEDMIVSPYIAGLNVGVDLVFFNGELKGWLIKERVSYSISGANNECGGQAQIAIARDWKEYKYDAEKAVRIISPMPHGVFGVDFKGEYITEINPGRFLTSSLAMFHKSSYNLAKLYVKLGLGEPYELGEYPTDKTILRMADCEPKLI